MCVYIIFRLVSVAEWPFAFGTVFYGNRNSFNNFQNEPNFDSFCGDVMTRLYVVKVIAFS